MKPSLPRRRRIAGFTLVEVFAGAAVASIVLGGLMTGSIAIQRSFSASDRLARAEGDLLRVADYMARDIRNATSINTTATSSVLLTATIGDYYDRKGTPANVTDDVPNAPVLGRTGATYGASPMTVRYLRSGTRISREVSRVDAGITTVTTTWIADNVETLAVTQDADGTVRFTSATAMNFSLRRGGTTTSPLPYVMASKQRNPIP